MAADVFRPEATGDAAGMLAPPLLKRPPSLNYGFSGDLADLESCAAAIRRGSKSFHLASLMLPVETRKAAYALYAFCRHSDDLVDTARTAHDALSRLRHRLDLIYAGRPSDHACDRAFARTVHDHAIPKIVPAALLDGFAMDLEGRRYQTIGALKDYATCVAATVGIMMSMVMGTGHASALARAADLGIAMQLTNIARDVGEDARNGRLYLPLDWLDEAGIDAEDFLADPRFTPALGSVVRRLLAEAERHYRLGHSGLASLPADCRHAIRTAALVYEEIGARIAANDHDSVSRRAHVPMTAKLALVMRARRPLSRPVAGSADPVLLKADGPPDPSAAMLVAQSTSAFMRAAQRRTGLASIEAAGLSDGGAVDRFADIMLRLQSRTRENSRFRRLAVRGKASGLA